MENIYEQFLAGP